MSYRLVREDRGCSSSSLGEFGSRRLYGLGGDSDRDAGRRDTDGGAGASSGSGSGCKRRSLRAVGSSVSPYGLLTFLQ